MEKIEETDERFTTINIPITSIAASSGQNDSGVFELNFKDERYMPFEGAGTISKWRLEFPDQFRQFDYDTIADVIVHLRYTSVDGGDKLKKSASESLKDYIKSVEELSQRQGLFTIFDLKHDFPNEWYKATELPPSDEGRVITLDKLSERLPIFTKSRQPDKIKAVDIILMTTSALPAAAIKITRSGEDNDFMDGVKIGAMKAFAIHDIELAMDKWELKISNTQVPLEKFWLVARYVLK